MALLWPLHTLLPEWQPSKLVKEMAMKDKVVIVTGSNAGVFVAHNPHRILISSAHDRHRL